MTSVLFLMRRSPHRPAILGHKSDFARRAGANEPATAQPGRSRHGNQRGRDRGASSRQPAASVEIEAALARVYAMPADLIRRASVLAQ